MQFVEIKRTKLEPPDFRGVKGRILRETGHGYLVISTVDGREVIVHPASVRHLTSTKDINHLSAVFGLTIQTPAVTKN